MSRDHRKLRVFALADELVVDIYSATKGFPVEEQYGLKAQIRRAAVSTPSNIVEGSARRTTSEYCNFLNIANGSAAEARYLIGLSQRLGFLAVDEAEALVARYTELTKGLQKLVMRLDPRGSRRASDRQSL